MIEPSASLFYRILTTVFGHKAAFGTRAVTKIEVVESDHPYCQTLCIAKNGVVMINRGFWTKHIKNFEDAKIVLLHELFHSVLGDHLKLEGIDSKEHLLRNISMDMRINAAISIAFTTNNYVRNVLNRLYPAYGPLGLLRPGSGYGHRSKYRLLYSSLYGSRGGYESYDPDTDQGFRVKTIFKSEESIRSALKILIPPEKMPDPGKVVFLGYHGDSTEGEASKSGEDQAKGVMQELDESIKDEIRDAISDKLSDAQGNLPGWSKHLMENMVKVIKSSRSINVQALEKFACSAKINTIKAFYTRPRRVSSVYPQNPLARDIALLASGYVPVLWRNRKDTSSSINRNVAIYLDVSGSVTSYLPQLLGVIANLRQNISKVFCFSNEVYEHTLDELVKGNYKSTGGTDFDCLIKHATDNRIDKIIIFTDGYAYCDADNQKKAKEIIKDAAVVYFGGHTRENFFDSTYGKSFKLEELL